MKFPTLDISNSALRSSMVQYQIGNLKTYVQVTNSTTTTLQNEIQTGLYPTRQP